MKTDSQLRDDIARLTAQLGPRRPNRCGRCPIRRKINYLRRKLRILNHLTKVTQRDAQQNREHSLAYYQVNRARINIERRKPLDHWYRKAIARFQKENRRRFFATVARLNKGVHRRAHSRILRVLRRRLNNVFRAGRAFSKTARELLGCEVPFFREYLEERWSPGMSWKNYGYRGWHIDHIVPCAAFDLNDPEQRAKCFHYSNMQPLWAKDNFEKRALNISD